MKPIRNLVLMLGIVLAFGTAIRAQQHSYTQAEIDAGSKLYDSNCGSCHGEDDEAYQHRVGRPGQRESAAARLRQRVRQRRQGQQRHQQQRQ